MPIIIIILNQSVTICVNRMPIKNVSKICLGQKKPTDCLRDTSYGLNKIIQTDSISEPNIIFCFKQNPRTR